MTLAPTVRLRVYPDDCGAFGHVNEAAFLRIFERARWEALAQGPGVNVFSPSGAWPAIRRASMEYFAPVFPGQLLRFEMSLLHYGRSSFSVHQLARRDADGALVAAGDFVAVCVDSEGRPSSIPPGVAHALGVRPAGVSQFPRHVLRDGRQVTVEVQGDGPAVLFIHGFPMDRTMWRPLIERLPGWARIAPDLPGFGLSDPSPGDLSMAAYADELVALLDTLAIKRAVLCGLSMGGYVAFELWRRHQDRVRALILISTRAEPDTADSRAARDSSIHAVEQSGLAPFAESMLPKLLAPINVRSDGVAPHVRTMILDGQVRGVVNALAAMRDRSDSTPLLSGITVPTMVIAGAEDTLIPGGTSRALARAIPGARFETVAGAGHVPPLEQSETTGNLIRDFLDALI